MQVTKSLFVLLLLCGGVFNNRLVYAQLPTADKSQGLNRPVPQEARDQVRRALEMRSHDRTDEALALLKQAIARAPHYVAAHLAYAETESHYQGRYDEVRAEYDALLAKQPDNPVYLLVLAEALTDSFTSKSYTGRLEKIVAVAPDWVWAHYARARLRQREAPSQAISELRQCIAKDPTAGVPYFALAALLERDGQLDDALDVTKQMSTLSGTFHERGLFQYWRLRFRKAAGSATEKAVVTDELHRLAAASRDVDLLLGISDVLEIVGRDRAAAEKLRDRIRQLDPAWYPERGKRLNIIMRPEDDAARRMRFANQDYALLGEINAAWEGPTPAESMVLLEKLIPRAPRHELKYYLYRSLFELAEEAGDAAALLKYGEARLALEPGNIPLLYKIALALANEPKYLSHALRFARQAEQATAEFRPLTRPMNSDPDLFAETYPPEKQREIYRMRRARALESLGWTLCQSGVYEEAVSRLRQSVELVREQRNLAYLATALTKIGQADEARKFSEEAENLLAASLKKALASERSNQASDFTLKTIDGRAVRLADLKGKVVLLNFWATWCGPCIKEMPYLVSLYEKYRSEGFELLAISVDDKADRDEVIAFAPKHGMIFPVLFDDGVRSRYGVNAFPTNVFIDRQGRERHRLAGVGPETARSLEIIIAELLKEGR